PLLVEWDRQIRQTSEPAVDQPEVRQDHRPYVRIRLFVQELGQQVARDVELTQLTIAVRATPTHLEELPLPRRQTLLRQPVDHVREQIVDGASLGCLVLSQQCLGLRPQEVERARRGDDGVDIEEPGRLTGPPVATQRFGYVWRRRARGADRTGCPSLALAEVTNHRLLVVKPDHLVPAVFTYHTLDVSSPVPEPTGRVRCRQSIAWGLVQYRVTEPRMEKGPVAHTVQLEDLLQQVVEFVDRPRPLDPLSHLHDRAHELPIQRGELVRVLGGYRPGPQRIGLDLIARGIIVIGSGRLRRIRKITQPLVEAMGDGIAKGEE